MCDELKDVYLNLQGWNYTHWGFVFIMLGDSDKIDFHVVKFSITQIGDLSTISHQYNASKAKFMAR